MSTKSITFIFLLLIASVYSSTCADDLVDQSGVGTYAAIAFSVVTVVIAAIYIAGTALNDANMLVFAKDELFHLGMSAILVLCVGGIMLSSCSFFNYFLSNSLAPMGVTSSCFQSGPTGFSSTQAATCYLTSLDNTASSLIRMLTKQGISKEMNSAEIIGVYTPWSGGIMTPLKPYLKTQSMQLDMITFTFIMPALVSISMQKVLLYFEIDFIKWLIPIALLFRILPLTRNMGNMLLALLIALYAIIPIMYALNGAMDNVVYQSGCNIVKDYVLGDCNSPYNFWAIARFMPQAFFLPNLTIVLVITFLSSVNKALKVLT
jgi:hypothetical protein